MTQSPEAVDLWRDLPDDPRGYFRDSFLLGLVQTAIFGMWIANAIEYWKALLVWSAGTPDQARRLRSVAIDTYMVFKWFAVTVLVFGGVEHRAGRLLATYLIASSLFSYFYYHVWKKPSRRHSHRRQVRRTMAFVLSFFFGIFSYAYILWSGYRDAIAWPVSPPRFSDALLMSLSNAFTANFAAFETVGDGVRWVLAGQMLFVFAFLVIVVVNSVPSQDAD